MCKHDRTECDMDIFAEACEGHPQHVCSLALSLVEHGHQCWTFASLAPLYKPDEVLTAYSIAVDYFRRAAA
jgi:hypothetical protein